MTKLEFQDLQSRAASSGMTLKDFLRAEGVSYITYHYWRKKMRSESKTYPVAPITLKQQREMPTGELHMQSAELPGVILAFPNEVKAHFGRGSGSKITKIRILIFRDLQKKNILYY